MSLIFVRCHDNIYTIKNILQKLRLIISLNSTEFNELDELRKKRNKLIHEMRSISREVAVECFTKMIFGSFHSKKSH